MKGLPKAAIFAVAVLALGCKVGDSRAADGGSADADDGLVPRSDGGIHGRDGGGTPRGDAAITCQPLRERVRVTAVDVSPEAVSVGSPGGFSSNRPVILSPLADGTAKIGWTTMSGTNRVTPLDDSDHRAGEDLPIEGSEIRGFVAHADGAAALIRRDDEMALIRIDAGGATTLDVSFVGGNDHDAVGDKWIDSWSHDGRLAWSGAQYAVYFGHTQLWDSGNHQGDYYRIVGTDGSLSTGWGWGCSHSLDVRLAYGDGEFAPVCLSDCYPGKGIYYRHTTKVSDEPTGNCLGGSAALLGGLVATSGGYWLSFASPEGRDSVDVGLVYVPSTGPVGDPVWLTDTSSLNERSPHLARYGSNHLLAAWSADSDTWIAVVDELGAIVEGPVSINARFAERDDFASFPNGDVGWAYAWGDSSALKVVRVQACD